MIKRLRVSELPEFDAAEYLKSDEDVAAYLATVLEEKDTALLAAATGDIARARGLSQVVQVAEESGVAPEFLNAVRPGSAVVPAPKP